MTQDSSPYPHLSVQAMSVTELTCIPVTGLTPVEIDMAFQRRMALMSAPAALAGLMGSPRRNGSWADIFHRFAMSVAVLGSASYALYWFFKVSMLYVCFVNNPREPGWLVKTCFEF